MRDGAAFWSVFIPSTMGTTMNTTSLPHRHARRTKAVAHPGLREEPGLCPGAGRLQRS
jgi:hypothetical protein